MELKDMIEIIKDIQKDCNINGSCDPEFYCKELGVDMGGLVHLLMCVFMIYLRDRISMKEKILELEQKNEILEKYVETHTENGRIKQSDMIKAGLPIAKKEKKSLVGMKLLQKLGNTDKEIMEYFNISRSTLWRWKKEIAELERKGKSLI